MPWFDEARLVRLEEKMDALKSILLGVARSSRRSEWKETNIMATVADLVNEVAQVKSVEAAAVAAIQGLIAKVEEAKASTDPAALDAAIGELKASSDALAAAIPANTPAEPTA